MDSAFAAKRTSKHMKQHRKVVHVELKEPCKDKRHWYFGSITAIYDILPVDVVGIAHTTLWNVLSKNGKYTTKTATIRLGVLHSRQTNRGKHTSNN